ncbi:MAG: response regulator transcription factor [Nitrospirae bacterium]|nr:response regulator transcription factor [Nitrospirota bacterium]
MAHLNPRGLSDREISILIVDDHALFRQGLRRILESDHGFAVVGEATDGGEAIQLARELHPNIILMDISMPHLNGLEATQKIKRLLPKTDVLLLTMHEDTFLQEEGLRMGASGYILKKSVDRDLFEAIRRVRSGYPYSPPPNMKGGKSSIVPPSYETLSFREKEILRLLARGMTNREISEFLYISVNTVETHRRNVMKKLNIHNLSEIIKYALVHGLIQG